MMVNFTLININNILENFCHMQTLITESWRLKTPKQRLYDQH